jgi:GNAT superfamily N-acetyltransferase
MNLTFHLLNASESEKVCRELTHTLPEYFGIQEANERYAKGVRELLTFGAKHNGIYLGLISLETHFSNNANIYWMAVRKEYHGQGIGCSLLKYAEAYCSKKQFGSMTVETLSPAEKDPNYLKTYDFYQRNGFEPLFELNTYGPDFKMVYLYKKLGEMMSPKFRYIFKPVEVKDRLLVHEWLVQPYIAEWIHGIGLQNTLNGLEKFFQGESNTTYWIGYDKNTPFAFLITSPEGNDATTLDLFICDLNYLGKGIAVPMIQEFLISQFPNVKKVLIDPEATNKRAIHVYQKVGFKIISEFIASWHPVPHYQMELYMKDLLETTK